MHSEKSEKSMNENRERWTKKWGGAENTIEVKRPVKEELYQK